MLNRNRPRSTKEPSKISNCRIDKGVYFSQLEPIRLQFQASAHNDSLTFDSSKEIRPNKKKYLVVLFLLKLKYIKLLTQSAEKIWNLND